MQTQNTNLSKKTGFALAELMVVIAVLSILMVLLLPVLATARDRAHTSVCTSNLHQVALVLKMYASDNDGVYPVNRPETQHQKKQAVWDLLTAYTQDPQIFHCPNEHGPVAQAPGYSYRAARWNDPSVLSQKSLRPASGTVVVSCAEHTERSGENGWNLETSGHLIGPLIVAREDGSVSRIMADEVEAWAYHRGRWYVGSAVCPPDSICMEHYPGESWPPWQ